MKNKIMRLLCLFLCAALLMGTVPVTGFATQSHAAEELPEAVSAVWTSPQYQAHVEVPDVSAQTPLFFSGGKVYHTSAASAAPELKAALLNRSQTVTIYYEIPIAQFTDMGLLELGKEIFAAACAHNGTPNEGDYLRWSCARWAINAKAFSYNSDRTCYQSTMTISLTYFDTYEQEAAVTEQIENLLAQLNPTGTDYQKLKTVYDWICANIVYDFDNLNDDAYLLKFSAYAALVDKTAVCQGYALLLYRLALEMGIDCRIICGIGNGGDHAWNIIELDGLYYNLDSTWDAQWKQAGLDYPYFLTSDANFGDHTRDTEFASESFYAAYPMGQTDYVPEQNMGPEIIMSGTCGTGVRWRLDVRGTLSIQGTGEMGDYISYSGRCSAPWYDWRASILSVYIDEGITNIGFGAFYGCSSITDVAIPSSVTRIGGFAFYGCNSLRSIAIPDNVTDIGDKVFCGCSSLTSITIPKSVSSIGGAAFSGCSSLTSISIPESVASIGAYTFDGCNSLTNITIPEGVSSIGMYAFEDCSSLTSVIIPKSVTSIGESAFRFCSGLTSVSIPESVTSISAYTFDGCSSLTNITIPKSVTSIGGTAFSGCSSLISISIPESVTSIGGHAFSYCSGLTSITIPESVTSIGGAAFSGCNGLTSITIPNGVISVGDAAFLGCTSLTSIIIPESVTSIGAYTFYACSSLTSISISDGVTSIGEYAFYDCAMLKNVYYGGTAEAWVSITNRPDVPYVHCGCTSPDNHWSVTMVNATCSEGDFCLHSCACGYSYNEILGVPLGHEWIDATCTAPKTCSACSITEGDPLGHTEEIVVGTAATCTKSGLTDGKKCSVCEKETVTQQVIPARGHLYSSGVDGTCNECGIHRENTEDRTVMHMFRMYDPNSGEHFYTGSEEERDNLVAAGWNYEGVGFTFSRTTGMPVYRLYDPITGEHLYTMEEPVKTGDKYKGEGLFYGRDLYECEDRIWIYEGIAFNSAYDTEVPQYRLHNPNETRGAYHFTASSVERDNLIAAGWEYQGIGFYSCWK